MKTHPQASNSITKRLQHRCFPVKLAEFLRTPFYIEHLWWLLLNKLKESLPVLALGVLTLPCMMLKNGQTHFKHFAVFIPQDFGSKFRHFSKLCTKRVNSTNFGKILPVGNVLRGSHPGHPLFMESFLYYNLSSRKNTTLSFTCSLVDFTSSN